MKYLGQHYPSLHVYILKQLNEKDKIEEYMSQCKKFEDDSLEEDLQNYSLYVHGYFLIWLDLQREAGKLRQGMCFLIFLILLNSQRQEVGVQK